jgi:dual specificity tyrosine-phosphorylation-regulated kinase 2/3/4
MAPPSLLNSSGSVKETPTRIPRISSRTSAVGSPTSKNSGIIERRASLNVGGLVAGSTDPSPTPGDASINEFGVLDNGDKSMSKLTAATQRQSVRGSPSSRVPRQVTATLSGAPTPRKSNRDSVSFGGLRKSSVGSVASASSVAPSESHHRFSALSPSKGFKMLTPKMSLPAARSSASQSVHQGNNSPSSSRQSLSTPSPSPTSIDEEELLGDEEMMHYIRRQQTKKMANGASQKELDDLLAFPDPLPPGQALSPAGILPHRLQLIFYPDMQYSPAVLQSSQVQYLSQYERKEILDFPSVYCFGARSKKKPATPENTTNNFGYDDERGDYLVVNHDHLAYRYEIIDILGKGSFGQVLHCRDHCTGESVAIKIIRNKKRFHHQALVEIKILDNLRKWVRFSSIPKQFDLIVL